MFLQPNAETQDLNSDALLELLPAKTAVNVALCYHLYTAYYESVAAYPAQCDALLPMPYPPISAAKLKTYAIFSSSTPLPSTVAAVNPGVRRQLKDTLLLPNDSIPAGMNGPTPGSSNLTQADTAQGTCYGLACDGPSTAALTSASELQWNTELFWDTLCFAESAVRITETEVKSWHTDKSTAIKILATVRLKSAGTWCTPTMSHVL
jgi:hypothetical protein